MLLDGLGLQYYEKLQCSLSNRSVNKHCLVKNGGYEENDTFPDTSLFGLTSLVRMCLNGSLSHNLEYYRVFTKLPFSLL